MIYTIKSKSHTKVVKLFDEMIAKMETSNKCVEWQEVTYLLDDKGRVLQTSYPTN